jgi:hypothetical protein
MPWKRFKNAEAFEIQVFDSGRRKKESGKSTRREVEELSSAKKLGRLKYLLLQLNLDIPDTKNLYGQDRKKSGIKRVPVY